MQISRFETNSTFICNNSGMNLYDLLNYELGVTSHAERRFILIFEHKSLDDIH